MGNSRGNEVFDKVARKLQLLDLDDKARTEIMTALIEGLQDLDWDTEDESLARFVHDPATVEAFRRCDIDVEEWMHHPVEGRPGDEDDEEGEE